MDNGKGRVLKNSALYTFSSLLVKAINFFLLPVYTFFLGPEDYGTVNLINSFTQVATYIIAFSLYSAVIRFYADYKDDREKIKRLYGTVLIFIFISGITFSSIGLLLNKQLVDWFFKGISFFPIVLIALVSLIFTCMHTMHQSIMQSMQQGKKLTAVNLSVFVLLVFFKLLFIGVLKLGASGVLLSTLIVNVGYFIYMVFDLKKNNLVVFTLDTKLLKDSLKYSIPIVPHNLSTHIASFASRIFINTSGSLASVGLYGVAYQFSVVIDTVQASVNRAFQPWFFEFMSTNKQENKREVVKLSRFLLMLYSVLYMLIGLFSQEVIIFMTTEKYIMAWTVIPVLVSAFSVKSLYYFYVNILFYYKEAARKIFIATIIGSVVDIIFAYILVPYYGMYGAAFAFLLAKIVVVIIVVLMSRIYDIGYRLADMLIIIFTNLFFLALGLYLSYTFFVTKFSWVNLLYKIGVFALYLIYLYITNRKMINSILFNIRKRLRDKSI